MQTPSWQQQLDQARASKTANVICMKWGDRYDAYWVNRLYAMVARNTTWTINFVCFTDDPTGIRDDITCRPLPEVKFNAAEIGKYWPKLGMMQNNLGGLEGMTLFLDLDLVIIENIDALFEADGRFFIIREWKDPHLGFGNSSVVRFFIGHEANVLDRFYATSKSDIVSKFSSKEQNFLTKVAEEVTFWPTDWCVPFSHVCLPRNRVLRFFSAAQKPKLGKILVFFGSITPESAMRGEHQRNKRVGSGNGLQLIKRRFGPATWLRDYWRE